MSDGQPLGRLAPLELDAPASGRVAGRAELLFAGGRRHVDPKTGIPLYGPRSLGTSRHKREVHVGFIGTGESADARPEVPRADVLGSGRRRRSRAVPRLLERTRGSAATWSDAELVESIKRHEATDILGIKNGRQRFEAFLELLQQKLDSDHQRTTRSTTSFWPFRQDLYQRCRSVEYIEKGLGDVHRDLRRAFKAMAMQYRQADPDPACRRRPG